MKLDPNDIYQLGDHMEEELRAKFMTYANVDDGSYFKEKVKSDIEFMFGAMMRGENMMGDLQPYLSLTMNRVDGWLDYNYAEWRQSFESTFEVESTRKGLTHQSLLDSYENRQINTIFLSLYG